ncbi:MAG: DUF11 domain-containing protein [Acidobacteria bacterium]|nr:DUF11 domain-containing protein [Acidobacteriota bacterium]
MFVLSFITIAAAVSASTAPAFESGGSEFVTTYADDCVTPKTIFDPGEVVCVQAGNFPVATDWGHSYRRFSWVAPDRQVIEQTNVKADPQYDRFAIPGSGSPGTWYVTTLDVDSSRFANAKFVVRSPFSRTTNLTILKDGPATIFAGQTVEYAVTVSNPGPDTAEGIEFTTEVPSNMTFVALKQADGPFFECKTPLRGETGRIYCSTKGMGLDDSARFYAYYAVNPDVREGTICSASTHVTSYTEELNKEDNFTVTESEVVLEKPPEGGEPPPDND